MTTAERISDHIIKLQQMVLQKDQWVLPESIGYPDDRGLGDALLPWLGAFFTFIVVAVFVARLPLPHGQMGVLLLACFAALLWAWRYWWHTRQPLGGEILDWRGCTVDVVQRTVHTVGHRKMQQWTLEPAQAWSLGIMQLPSNNQRSQRHLLYCVIELRHVRRGPVVELCRIHAGRDSLSRRLALDQLAQHMAQRLGIRFSGEGLVPTDRTRGLLQ